MYARKRDTTNQKTINHMPKKIYTIPIFIVCLLIIIFLIPNLIEDRVKIDRYIQFVILIIAAIGILLTAYFGWSNKKDQLKDIERKYISEYGKHTEIINFIEKNIDQNNNLKEDNLLNDENRPDVGELIKFIRFIKQLYMEIEDGTISKNVAKQWCSKYPLAIYDHEFFRIGFDSYSLPEWQFFRDYCELIRKNNNF